MKSAFPTTSFTKNGISNGHDMGMSLRDWFAGQALAGFQAHPSNPDKPEHISRYCYGIADAMMEARGAE